MGEQLEVLGEILARLNRDKERFEKLLENPVDAHSDECVRQALAGTELLIADVQVQIYKLSAGDREAVPGSETDSEADTWFRIIEQPGRAGLPRGFVNGHRGVRRCEFCGAGRNTVQNAPYGVCDIVKPETLMSSIATTDRPAEQAVRSKTIQPAWVRIVHWINAVAMVLMIMSGWQIYNASPLFGFLRFSHSITLGGWLGGALQWHFAAMWLLMVNGLVYLTLGLVTGRFRRKLLPITVDGVVGDTRAALTGKLSHADLTTYNYVQKLLYAGIIVVGIVIVLSGLAIWKPVQLQWLTALFGGYDVARYVHFFCMAAIVGFLVVHVALALLVPKSLRAMIIGKQA